MDMRLTFNEVASEYDRMRPLYVEELFDDALQYSGLNGSQKALEIGIGTGQATLPFLKTGCKLTAIELGDKMAAFSKAKYSEFENLDIINDDFETIALENDHYDFIYSAGAFQWIQQDIGYRKIHSLLKSEGVMALFWHRLIPAEEYAHVQAAIDKVYDKYGHLFQEIPQQHNGENRMEKVDIIRGYGFTDVMMKTYHQTQVYDSESYVSSANTNCLIIALPEDTRIRFGEELYEAVERNGGKFAYDNPIDLYLARKS